MHPDRKDPIYSILYSELRRSELARLLILLANVFHSSRGKALEM